MTANATPRVGGLRPPGVIAEFFRGVATLARGFGYWRTRPGAMALGLIPAAIVFAIIIALIVALMVNMDPLTLFLTGFAERWDPAWRGVLRIGFGVALVVGLVVLSAFVFTALTLAIGDWFYARIWRIVEADLGGFPAGTAPGFWRSAADGVRLVARAILTGLLLALLGLVPVVGGVLGAALGVFLSGRLLALELTTRPLEERGMSRRERLAALRGHGPRVLGFGVAVHVCFFIPGGALLVMPAAVAGATVLTRHVRGETTSRPVVDLSAAAG